ncbi:MAG: roadblock/LC7 domain-containing protein, partial [candidate division Zixibacteria bacterium]|nr:roadblock/LC7 domain-containing protein [candidate division Zixibacteria bacterium]
VGEPEFSVLFHQGEKDHIHICLVGERSILVVIFDDRTTIGLVRLYAKETSEELTTILESATKGKRDRSAEMAPDFSASLEDKLDDVFGE